MQTSLVWQSRNAGKVPGSRNQAATNKTPLNADNEDNVMVLGEEWEDLFGSNIENVNGFSCESSNEDNIDINYNNKKRRRH